MITDKSEYKEFLREDQKALHISGSRLKLFFLKRMKPTWKYEILLRKAEYYHNCKKGLLWKPIQIWTYYRVKKYGWKLGYSIPINVFGKGLSIAHVGTIVVNAAAKVGDYCRIHACVNIGTAAGGNSKSPTLGNRIYIGPGAKIFGGIFIADGIAIGANAVVNKSFEEPNVTIAGVPAKVVSHKGSKGFHYQGEDNSGTEEKE